MLVARHLIRIGKEALCFKERIKDIRFKDIPNGKIMEDYVYEMALSYIVKSIQGDIDSSYFVFEETLEQVEDDLLAIVVNEDMSTILQRIIDLASVVIDSIYNHTHMRYTMGHYFILDSFSYDYIVISQYLETN